MDMPTPPPTGEKQSRQMSLWMSVRLAWNLGFIIAVPVVVMGFAGEYIDRYFQMTPLFTIVGFVLAALLSGIGIARRLREISRSS